MVPIDDLPITHLAKSEILHGGYTQKRLPVRLEEHLLVSFPYSKVED
jgi:hypothetical protein